MEKRIDKNQQVAALLDLHIVDFCILRRWFMNNFTALKADTFLFDDSVAAAASEESEEGLKTLRNILQEYRKRV